MARSKNTTLDFSEHRPIQRVALYARVSTLNGQQHPEMQLSELREYASRRGLPIHEEYVDQGVSGSKESRSALNRLMSDAQRCRFDAVLVWKIDRFGRSLKHLVNSLADLSARGISFVSLRDNLDLSTPSGRLMFQIIGAMAEFERALIPRASESRYPECESQRQASRPPAARRRFCKGAGASCQKSFLEGNIGAVSARHGHGIPGNSFEF
jgi:hypothetical protein